MDLSLLFHPLKIWPGSGRVGEGGEEGGRRKDEKEGEERVEGGGIKKVEGKGKK